MLSGDGHGIWDVFDKRMINDPQLTNQNVEIGEHCWIGEGSSVISGASLCDNVVVGAMSLVKGTFPNNCVIAGYPAKLIRKNTVWDGWFFKEAFNRIPDKYIKGTEMDN